MFSKRFRRCRCRCRRRRRHRHHHHLRSLLFEKKKQDTEPKKNIR